MIVRAELPFDAEPSASTSASRQIIPAPFALPTVQWHSGCTSHRIRSKPICSNAFAKLGVNARAELSKLMDSTDHPTTYIPAT
jgi:hypothetical protein